MGQLSHVVLLASIVASCISESIVTVSGKQLTNGAVPKSGLDPLPIKYPGPVKEVLTDRYGDVPEACQGKNYCTIKPPDYPQPPQDKFNKMFKGTKAISQPTLVIAEDGALYRNQGDPDYMDNCASVISNDPLYKVKTKRGWHTVVQAPEENYVQRVRIETCTQLGGACFTAFPTQSEFQTFCKQKYTVWEFLVEKPNGEGTEKVETELPTCCSCHYKLRV